MYYVFFMCKQFVSIGLYDTWVCRVTKICSHYIGEWQLTVSGHNHIVLHCLWIDLFIRLRPKYPQTKIAH